MLSEGLSATRYLHIFGDIKPPHLTVHFRNSQYASELVCPALVKLATQLLGSHLDQPLHLVMACQPGGSLPGMASVGVRACHLGMQLLEEVFECHSEARTEVLRLCQVCGFARVCGSGLLRGLEE